MSTPTDTPATLKEGLRIARTSERLLSIGDPLRTTLRQCDRVLEIAPELEPEVTEIRNRVQEVVDHVVAAAAVLLASLEMLGD